MLECFWKGRALWMRLSVGLSALCLIVSMHDFNVNPKISFVDTNSNVLLFISPLCPRARVI